MRFSLSLGRRDTLDRQTAQACMATNMGLPGFGTVMAGRPIGYVQAALTIAGFALSLILGARFILWAIAHWSQLYSPEADPWETLSQIWVNLRGALLGMVLFGVSWLWALVSSFMILHGVRKNGSAAKPPRLS